MPNEPNISFFSVLSVCLGMLLARLPEVILPINTLLFETADVYLFDFWFFRFIIIITLICSILKLTFRLSCISIARHRFRCTCFCFFSRTQNDASGCWDPSVAPFSSSLRFLSWWWPGIIEVRSCSRHPPLNKVKSRSLNLCNGCLCVSPSPFFCNMWTLWKK